MIEITYTDIYMLIPTPGVRQTHVIHPPKINTPKFKEISLLVVLQKERGVIEKGDMLKKHKKFAPIKEHRKKVNHDPPSKIKARGESQRKEYFDKTNKNIP
jgi:hypothetical protein